YISHPMNAQQSRQIFPTRRSSDLNIQAATGGFTMVGIDPTGPSGGTYLAALISSPGFRERYWDQGGTIGQIIIFIGAFAMLLGLDRKSTRLNSSHVKISYAVFCSK